MPAISGGARDEITCSTIMGDQHPFRAAHMAQTPCEEKSGHESTMEAGSEAVVLILGQSAKYGGSFPGCDPALSILAAQVEGV